jgi:hypothetical protein
MMHVSLVRGHFSIHFPFALGPIAMQTWLLGDSVDVFVASGGIPTLPLVSGMWESLLALTLHFVFVKTPLVRSYGLELLLLGLDTHMEE